MRDPAGDLGRRCWLLLIYRVPQDPPGRRTHIWRQLKQLGAVYLQQAAAILPKTLAQRADLESLAGWVEEVGGEASLLETSSPSPAWEARLLARFNAARDEEYAEVVENIERFEDEISRESRKGKFTFAELEDLESDWVKLEQWIARVHTRDFFGAPGHGLATAALEQARASLAEFTTQVYAHEDVQEQSNGADD